jgi:transposase
VPIDNLNVRGLAKTKQARHVIAAAPSATTLKRDDRHWKCSGCGELLDRDFNAAINITDEGILSSFPQPPVCGEVKRGGGCVRLPVGAAAIEIRRSQRI